MTRYLVVRAIVEGRIALRAGQHVNPDELGDARSIEALLERGLIVPVRTPAPRPHRVSEPQPEHMAAVPDVAFTRHGRVS